MDWTLTPLELTETLDRLADSVVAHGTRAEARALQELAAATRGLRPGAAAALVDWPGSEVARLRAFGIVHGAALRDLPAYAQHNLMARLRGGHVEEPAA